MKLDRGPNAAGPIVTGIAGAGFRINRGEPTSGGVLLSPEWWRPWDGLLSTEALAPLIETIPEFILLGTGATLRQPDRALIAALDAQGIGLEIMDSRAAARAWGVLRAEDRRVAAALMSL